MMQQPMVQPDQLGNQQQITQQMVLCPVRVVYETQILIPPGEQIQPNQTIFINPQNPPPWVQNRLQNQVLYVQQMPNIVSPIQQNIDQNQMYLQQNYSYQIPQVLGQERPMHIQNNFQNISTNVGNANERLYMANIGQIQNQLKQQNVQMMNNQIDMQRFLRPQVNQNYRPQVMVNPTQNIQNIQQMNVSNTQVVNTAPNMPNNINVVQNPISNVTVTMNNANIGQIQPRLQPAPNIRPVQQATKVTNTVNENNTINAPSVAVNVQNRLPIQQATKIGNMVFEHSVSNVNTIGNPVPRVPQHSYRPIQPRPQYRTHVQNVQTVAPVQNIPYYNQKQPPNQIQNYNVSNNRKRKSESPDESKKKMVAFETNVQTPNIINIKTSNEIGVNTSPVHKMDERLQTNAVQVKIPDSIPPRIVSDMSMPKNNIEIIKTLTANTSISVDKIENEKLVRNTVYTQARGRLLTDKEVKVNDVMSVSNEHIINALNANMTRQLPNSAINPTSIKEETKYSPSAVTSQNIGTAVTNDVKNTYTTGNMTIIERTIPMQESKPFNETPLKDNNVTRIRNTDTIEHRAVMNIKVEDSTINTNRVNFIDNKTTSVVPNDTAHTDRKPLNEIKEGLSDNNLGFNNTTSDNSSVTKTTNALNIKIEQYTSISDSIATDDGTATSDDANINKNQSDDKKVNKVDDNCDKSNIEELITIDNLLSNDSKPPEEDNVKMKACKIQLNANEIQSNTGQVKQVQLNNSKMEINDGILDKRVSKVNINNRKSNKVKEEEIMDKIIFKQEVYDQDILTHVLDGYVIQESNVAFPIRKPINEKIIYNQQTDGKKNKNEMKTPVDLPLLPFYYMHLNNDKVKEEKEKMEVKEELKKEKLEDKVVEIKNDKQVHPFSSLQQSEVKTWTVDQLIKHLYNQDWSETASILQEHELDGESLFLVSKSQLLQIGISEEHSDVICEFVHS